MKRKFADRPDLFDKMLPIAPPMSARPVLVDQDYSIYDALLRDDVSLVTEGIEKSTTSGLVTVGGDEYPVDVIVMATGFRANDFLWPMDVRGRHGCRLEDLWKPDGARAYLGSMVPGFPNFFMVYGPNTNPTGGLSVVDLQETVTRFALECIRGLIEQDKRSVDVTADGYWRYNAELDKSETVKLYSDPRAKSYYQNEYGRSAGNCPLDGRKLWGWLRDPAGSAIGDGLLADGSTDTTGIRPHFNQDLVVQ